MIRSVLDPLDEHEEGHIEEEERQKDDLWDELADDVELSIEVGVIEITNNHTEQHMTDAEDYGYLHLVRIEEDNLVASQLPDWIHTEWIRILFVAPGWIERLSLYNPILSCSVRDRPLGAEEIQRF